jgi:hypothetical protein
MTTTRVGAPLDGANAIAQTNPLAGSRKKQWPHPTYRR